MFKIALSDTYTWPVTVDLAEDGGKRHKATFDAEFKRVSQERVDQLVTEPPGDKALADEVMVGWSGVYDANDQELPYSEENRAKLLSITGVRAAIVRSFFDSLSGAPRKN